MSHHQNLMIYLAKTGEIDILWAKLWWRIAYSPKGQNHTMGDPLWDKILPSHGFVAIDRQWADENQWPVSMYLPSDHSKGVYLLEAYHQLHCLVCIILNHALRSLTRASV